jgi:exosortase C (VPDSG-CTERM-specific)
MTNQGTIVRRWLIAFLIAAVAFYRPFRDLVRFAVHTELYSHILLVPAISFYVVWTKLRSLPVGKSAGLFSLIGYIPAAALIAFYWFTHSAPFWTVKSNYLAAMICALVLTCIGNLFVLLGKEFVSAALFPSCFLIFMAPFPEPILNGLETFFQHSSACVAGWIFDLTGATVLHDGLFFVLPGITLQVAQECSGIHSSLVLFITSLVAGYFFFSSYKRRALLALFVIPLGIVRNAFRIYVIGQLCVHVSPDMINSFIHRHGGPIFFLLSLVPFFIFLHYLNKLEARRNSAAKKVNVGMVPN